MCHGDKLHTGKYKRKYLKGVVLIINEICLLIALIKGSKTHDLSLYSDIESGVALLKEGLANGQGDRR